MTLRIHKPVYGSSINMRTFCAMLRMLHEGDVSKTKIREELGIATGTEVKWLKLLGSDQPNMPGRLVYISGWDRTGSRGNWMALWSYGFEMVDAKKPKPMTGAQYAQRYKAKKRRALGLATIK
jgi:hypothetical protein